MRCTMKIFYLIIALLLFFLPLAHAVLIMNSTDFMAALMNSTLQANESIFIEDWNGTLEIVNNTIIVQPEFNHTDVNVSYNESLDLYGNYTVHGPAACPAELNMTGQFRNLTIGEVQNFVGNWTVGCPAPLQGASEHVNLQSNETRNLSGNYSVTCLPTVVQSISFWEIKTLGYNQSVSKNLSNQFSSFFFNYTCPPEVVSVQQVAQPLSINEDIAPGSCFEKKEGNVSIEVCAESPPECLPDIQVEYQTLYDLNETQDCENPIMVKDQALCYDRLSGYCPADVMLDGGCEGCTAFAVGTALAIQESNLSDCNARNLDLKGEKDALKTENDGLSVELAEKNAEKLGYQVVVNEYMQGLLVAIIVAAFIAVYYTRFHKDKSLPSVNQFKKTEKPAFRGKL